MAGIFGNLQPCCMHQLTLLYYDIMYKIRKHEKLTVQSGLDEHASTHSLFLHIRR